MPDKVLGVIPARFQSSRFPGKALALLASKPIIQHVWERSLRAATLSDVIIATDDIRIYNQALRFGARVAMTRPDHLSGTDRVAEVASGHTGASLIVNIQGDEPLLDPRAIDALVAPLRDNPSVQLTTLSRRLAADEDVDSPHLVKVVCDCRGRAL